MSLKLIDYSYYNTLSVVLLLPLFIVFFMCMVDLNRSKLFFRSLNGNTYFYTYPNDVVNFFSVFHLLIFLCNSVVLALLLMVVQHDNEFIFQNLLSSFVSSLFISSGYFLMKYLIYYFFCSFLNMKTKSKQMLILETSYLTIILLMILMLLSYVFLHLNTYDLSRKYLFFMALVGYLIRLGLLFKNNKNLLSSNFLHIFLYLCTLEIAPFVYFLISYVE